MKSLVNLLLTAGAATCTSVLTNRAVCGGNTGTTRDQWCDYSLDTNYYEEVVDTGVTREYYFSLDQVTFAPDGFSRIGYVVNGTFPGPTIEADWGDTVVVHVTNNLVEAKNGTSIHFHGIRQNYTNGMDGVTSITQCPTPPGSTITYKWKATQYGSSWYHSHIGLQAWEGVAGGIVINGPASANYDDDKGIILLSDWSHETVDELYPSALTTGPPILTTGLINGQNTWNDSGTILGTRFNTSFAAGSSYRLRLVNAAIDTYFKFSIDNHTLTVIAADFVPIVPYTTTVLDITMGQRYDVIITADQGSVADNFWMRAIPQNACSRNSNAANIRGIVYYGDEPGTPDTVGYAYVDACVDESLDDLVPHLALSAEKETYSDLEGVGLLSNSTVGLWAMNDSSFYMDWENPTLLQIYNNETDFTTRSNVLQVDNADKWAYLIIQAQFPVPHPIHLHGHDFYILAQGSGTYNSTDLRGLTNPTRRDVATLPASGYLVIAIKTDNPGAWLLHCHIGWHTDEGLALQYIERYDDARELIDYDLLDSNCEAWNTYTSNSSIEQDQYDNGI